jgi:hypothetical protein
LAILLIISDLTLSPTNADSRNALRIEDYRKNSCAVNGNEQVNRRVYVQRCDDVFRLMRLQDQYGLWHWKDSANDAKVGVGRLWRSYVPPQQRVLD